MADDWQQYFESDAKDEIQRLTQKFYKDLIRITLHRKLPDKKLTKTDVSLANQLLRGKSNNNSWSVIGQNGASVAFGAGTSLLLVNVTAKPEDFPIALFIIAFFLLGG